MTSDGMLNHIQLSAYSVFLLCMNICVLYLYQMMVLNWNIMCHNITLYNGFDYSLKSLTLSSKIYIQCANIIGVVNRKLVVIRLLLAFSFFFFFKYRYNSMEHSIDIHGMILV